MAVLAVNATGQNVAKKEDVIRKSRERFGDRFDYSLLPEWVCHRNKVKIVCRLHGEFECLLSNHLRHDGGCKKGICNKRRKTTEQYIQEAKAIHGDKWDYSKVNYTTTHSKIIIACPVHGEFQQRAKEHLNSEGCPKCSSRPLVDTSSFIERSAKVHNNKFDYSKVDYKLTDSKVEIICPKHGSFWQRPHRHLQGDGCKKCSNHISTKETAWLDSLGIPNLKRQHKLILGDKKCFVDGFDESTNTAYEFHGVYFHGHPKYCMGMKVNELTKEAFRDAHERTLEKESLIRKFGYNLVVMWEDEWCKMNNISLRHKEFTEGEEIQFHYNIMRHFEYQDGIRRLWMLGPKFAGMGEIEFYD